MIEIYINIRKVAQCETMQECQNLVSAYMRLMANSELDLGSISIVTGKGARRLWIRETLSKEAFKEWIDKLIEADMKILHESELMENGKKTYIESKQDSSP